MDNIVLLYDKWKFNKPIPNCIKPEILSHIFVTDKLIDSFELEFALRFAKKYKSFLHFERICYHIGNNNSSYNLNNSER